MAESTDRSIVGRYVSSKDGKLVEQIRSFKSRVESQEDEKSLRHQIQTGLHRERDEKLLVIKEEPREETGETDSDMHLHKLDLSPVKIRYLKDKPLALSRIMTKLKDKGFNCKFDLEAGKVEIRVKEAGHTEREALDIIRDNIAEIDVNTSALTDGSGDVEILVMKVGSLMKLVGLTDDMTYFGDSIRVAADKLTAQPSTSDTETKTREKPNAHSPVPITQTAAMVERNVTAGETIEENEAMKLTGSKYRYEIKFDAGMNAASIDQVAKEIGKRHDCKVTFQQTHGRRKEYTPVQMPEHPSLSYSVYGLKEARVRVVVDNIESPKLKAHIIVNTTNKELDLNRGRGVSWSILQAAGPSIQSDLRDQYPNGINDGELAVTGPGRIKICKKIYHGALPEYPQKKGSPVYEELKNKCLESLISLVFDSLTKAAAEREGHLTIALPAFGTGNLKYPSQFVVQLMYTAIKLFKDSEREIFSQIKEIIIVIHPETKLEVKQMFLAHRQTFELNTLHVASLEQIQEEQLREDQENIPKCEIRVIVGTSLLQVVNGDIHKACHVSEAILVLWSDEQIKDPNTNQGLTCLHPKSEWNCSAYIRELATSKCSVDLNSLERKILIHSYCKDDSEKCITEAIIRGLSKAASRTCNTFTIPIWSSDWGKGPMAAAKIICNAVSKAKANVYVVTVVINDFSIFDMFATEVGGYFRKKLHQPADTSEIVDKLWKKTHAEKASMSHTDMVAKMMKTNTDTVVLIESDSKDTNKAAAEEFEARLQSKARELIKKISPQS